MKKYPSRKLVFLLVASSFITAPALALIGTWTANPVNGDWNLSSNWSSMAAPNGPTDIATFGLSSMTSVLLSANTEVDSIVFNAGASAYTIAASATRTLTVSGAGIVNNSALVQSLVADVDNSGRSGAVTFTHNAAVGSATSVIANGSPVANVGGANINFFNYATAGQGSLTANGGATLAGNSATISFYDRSSADRAALTVNGGVVRGGYWATAHFYDNSTAGSANITTNGGMFGGSGIIDIGGIVQFQNNASAAQAAITNNGGTANGAGGGQTSFSNTSRAGAATIINNGGTVEGGLGGRTGFNENSSAGSSVIINNGGKNPFSSGGVTVFQGNSSAGTATLIANGGPSGGPIVGGEIVFSGNATADHARIKVFDNGRLTIRQHNALGITIGSLEGNGQVYLGGNNLLVGSNNLNTEFSGVMHDGDVFGNDPTGGSMTKVGAGTLVLSGQNVNTGQTTVSSGKLIINGSVLTPVIVKGGTLSGTGTMGAVSVNSGATFAPGVGTSILCIAGDLRLALSSNYLFEINGAVVGAEYGSTRVSGAVALGGATLSLDLTFQPVAGTTFTLIENNGTSPISGTFAGLSEGAIFEASGQVFAITYVGGSGNDVTITAVVPEPTTLLLLCAGAFVIAAHLRRSTTHSSSPAWR